LDQAQQRTSGKVSTLSICFEIGKVLRRVRAVRGRGTASFGKFSGFHASTTTGRNPLAALTQGVVNLAKDLFTTSFYATP